MGDSGGDEVCWLNRVCPDCGALRDSLDEDELEDEPVPCPRCGSTNAPP